MFYRQSASLYGTAAADGATQAGLLQLVYSHLAQDLLRAADAVSRQNIEARCAASNHAFLLLGHLESWAQEADDPALTSSLLDFYRFLRGSILQGQATPAADAFERLAHLVLATGSAWKTKEDQLGAVSRAAGLQSGAQESISFHA